MFRPRDQAVTAVCLALCLAGCNRAGKTPDLPHAPAALSARFYAPRGWTWGTIHLSDGAPVRYGVASPPVVPRGNVLLLPDRDEPAEVWFETANDLLDRGYTVWLMEGGAAKGAAALDPAKGALRTMVGAVIRPPAKAPLVIVGQGLGSTLAIRTLGEGRVSGVKGAVLASPTLDLAGIDPSGIAWDVTPEQVEGAAEWASRARVGWLPLPGDGQPRLTRAYPVDLDPKRAGLAATWRRSDPSLKPRRTTLGWVWGYDQAIQAARAPSPYAGVTARVVITATPSDTRAAAACTRLPTCTLWAIPTSAPHLAPDVMRKAWLERITLLVGR